jgi:acetate---CoA ligase (ADP-forming)
MRPSDGVQRMLAPRGIAVVGASRDPRKRGYQTIASLLASGYPHPIYPVNPKEEEILGLRAYGSLARIDGEVDLAFVVTPASTVSAILRECGQKGVGGAVVVAVGFGETGSSGRAHEHAIARIADDFGIRVIGPNTSGVFNLPEKVNLTGLADVPQGRIGIISQSGNVLLSLVTEAQGHRYGGFSAYVGIGNEVDVRFHECLAYLGDDRSTGAVVVYAEGFKDGRRFLQTARAVAATKPIVMLKAGRSEQGRRSILSHTGALAGAARIAEAALKQAGVTVVRRSDELLPMASALESLPGLHGGRIAVLADGGGHATLATDAIAQEAALELPDLGVSTRAQLASLLTAAASTRNPVDVAGATDANPELFADCLEALLDDDAVDGVVMVGLFGGYGTRFAKEFEAVEVRTARRFVELVARTRKPLVVQSSYATAAPAAHDVLREGGIPVFEFIETAVGSLAALAGRSQYLRTYDDRSAFRADGAANGAAGRRALLEPAGRALLDAAGLPVGSWAFVKTAAEAERAADRIGGPVALKLVSSALLHKSDAGAVMLDVPQAEVAVAAEDLVARVRERVEGLEVSGILVERMAAEGIELVVGSVRDPSFGPVVMVGLGGVLIEHLDDVSFRAAPLTRLEACEMLDELAGRALLDGARGAAAVSRDHVVDVILKVSALATSRPDILELDLNPVIAHPGGVTLVDVRVIVSEAS